MTNAPTPTRFFEQVVLVSEDGRRTIIQRDYSTGETEFWSIMTINWKLGEQKGAAQAPFKIDAATREEAFAAYEAAFAIAEPAAQQEIKEKLEQHARREQSKIILAGATDPVTFGQRANGQG